MDIVKPTNRPQLWSLIDRRLGVKLPFGRFTPGHSSPFDFVADGFFNGGKDLAAWANRRGGKTLAASILAALDYRFNDAGPMAGRVLAGSEEQAKALYAYWLQWCWKLLPDRLRGRPAVLRTRLDNGSFEILAASPRQVRGPGIQRLFWDEVDEIPPDIFAASVGTLNSLGGVPSRTVSTSTWHHAHGPMGELVEHADQRGITLHKWNIWEVIEQCPRERHDDGRGCLSCPLAGACLAKAVELNPKAKVGVAAQARHGLFPIDDAIRQLRLWSRQQWLAEAECQRPTLDGLVYSAFDPAEHVVSDLDFQDDLPTYRAVDWGLNDFVCLWIQAGKSGQVHVVDEYWTGQATVHQVARDILERHGARRIEATYCDPAGAGRNDQSGYSDVEIFKGCGIPCTFARSAKARSVQEGIRLVRAALCNGAGVSRLRIAGRCRQLIRAFESYRLRAVNGIYLDEPIKPQPCDHPMDALRYYFVNRELGGDKVCQMGWTGQK